MENSNEENLGSILYIEGDRLYLNNLVITDSEIVNYFKDLPEISRCERFETALKVGVISLKTIAINERVDYIQKEFNVLDSKFTLKIEKFYTDIEEQLKDSFGDKGSLSTIITSHFGENGDIVKKIFDPNLPGTPLNSLLTSLKRDISDLRSDLKLSEKTAEIEEKTPLKGSKFEDVCKNILSDFAITTGDMLECTTDEIGKIPRSKAGDYVITTGGKLQRKIVFETKDRELKSEPQILRELDEAMKNRDANYGILVGKYVESLPKSVNWFKEYPNNRLAICLSSKESDDELHSEMLLIAYKWARIKTLAEFVCSKDLDFNKIADKLNHIREKLNDFSRIKIQCSNIETASSQIRAIMKEFENIINYEIEDLLEIIEREES